MAYPVLDFEQYMSLSDDECESRIAIAKTKLQGTTVVLAHHYQRADVYKHADLVGDSFKLAKLASRAKEKNIVFCGVHFMAEVADILSRDDQVAILPDLAAGCSMADMANLSKVRRCWDELSEIIHPEKEITPITYINSAADLKAFCAEQDGIVCTSSNALDVLEWSFSRRQKVLFFPDQHLGRWTARQMGLSASDIKVWNPEIKFGGLSESEIRDSKILLWKGHCSVHQMFQPEHIDKFRSEYPDGKVISHPECRFEVCEQSDYVGSTEYIVNTISAASRGTRWLVGTELNLVNRLAEEFIAQEKVIKFMSPVVCMCSTMNRIDPQHLLWCLENLIDGNVVNQIAVDETVKKLARKSLDRMLALS